MTEFSFHVCCNEQIERSAVYIAAYSRQSLDLKYSTGTWYSDTVLLSTFSALQSIIPIRAYSIVNCECDLQPQIHSSTLILTLMQYRVHCTREFFW